MPEIDIEKYAQGLSERIRACANAVGNGEELSRRTGIPRSTLESYLTGDSEPKASRLVAIAQAAQASVGWLATGDGEMVAAAPDQADSKEDIYAYIPLYDANISQGHGGYGAWNQGVKILAMLAFTKYSLRRKGLVPAQLAAVRVDGDSNEPTLSDGDTVMVDLSRNALQGEAFYVIRIDDLLYAKRLQREFDGSILVISANTAYKTITVPHDRLDSFEIIGRVVWAGGWMV